MPVVLIFVLWLGFNFWSCVNAGPPAASYNSVIAAGVPKPIGERANYDEMFAQLKAAGIDVFMPFSEYQEVPEPKTLSYEVDFYPQHKRSDAAKIALRKHDMKVLVPASILYGDGDAEMPPLQQDPLRRLIDWLGRKYVFGVYAIDEPVLQNTSASKCKAIYDRVKQVDRTLPVIMVHASIPEGCDTSAKVSDYLEKVKVASQYADIVGFDVYPVPAHLMKVKSPYSALDVYPPPARTVADYIRFLKEQLPGKQHIMILQAFSLRDQGHNALLATLYRDRRPTKEELQSMAAEVRRNHAILGWWGQSLLKKDGLAFWNDVLSITGSTSR